MKKLFLGVAAVALLGTVGCKKDYTCSCDASSTVSSDLGFGQSSTTTDISQDYAINDAKKDEAEDRCNRYEESGNTTTSFFGTTTTTESTCTLSEM